jgi:hypothetical protein
VLPLLVGALVVQALVIGLFGIDTQNRTLEELAPEAAPEAGLMARKAG